MVQMLSIHFDRPLIELEFPFAVGFICRTHIVRNLEDKLKSELFLSDKFLGWWLLTCLETRRKKGWCTARLGKNMIFSCRSYELNGTKKRSRRRRRKGKTQEPNVSKYFLKNKADVVYHNCRSQALCDAGIGEELFDNNDPESINALIKKWESREKKDTATFVTDIKALHDKQRHDVKSAFCGISGLYTIKEEYEEFAAGADFWDLGLSEKNEYLNKISDVPVITPSTAKDPLEAVDLLSVSFLPSEVSALKAKAQRILNGNIRFGFSGPKSRIVCSDSGLQPRSVLAVGSHGYKCDSSCEVSQDLFTYPRNCIRQQRSA